MITVLDTESGQVVSVEEADAEEGLRGGRYAVSAQGPVRLRNENGDRFEVDPQNLGGALNGGLRLETSAETEDADLERRFGDAPVTAALEGAARALPGSDNILAIARHELGGDSVSENLVAQRERAERNPIASMGGRLVGEVGIGALTAGGSLEAGGLRAILGGAAADGALGALTASLNDAGLEGRPIEAEQVLGDAAFGALIGLGTAGLFHGAASGMRRGARGASRLTGYADDLARRGLSPGGEARQLAGGIEAAINPRAEGRLQQLARRFSSVDPDDLAMVAANPRRAFDAAGFESLARRAADDLAGLGGRVDEAVEVLGRTETRSALLARAAADASEHAPQAAREVLDGVRSRLAEGVSTFSGRDRGGRAIRRALGELEGLTPTDPASALSALDRAVRIVDDLAPGAGDEGARALLREVRDTMSAVASEPQLFGGGAAAWSRLDQASTAWRGAREALEATQRDLSRELTERGAATSERIARLGESLDAAADVLSTLGEAGVDASEARRLLGSARETLGAAVSHGELRGAALRGLATEHGGALREIVTHAAGDVAGRAGGVLGALLAGGPGYAVGRTLGGAVGTVLDAASRPVSTYQRIARLGEAVNRYAPRVEEGLGRLRRVLESGQLERVVETASRSTSRVLTRLHGSADERRSEYVEVRDQLRELALEPARLEDALAPNVGGVAEASPALADGLALTATRGVQYLAQQLPPADQVSIFGADLEPSQFEVDSFLRRYEAIEDPVGLLDRMAEGSLHVEHVEAAQAVYPQIMADIRARVMETIGELEERPAYAVRLQVGTLLGVAADPTLEPAFIELLQQRYAHTSAQHAAQTSPGAQVQPTGSLARVGSATSAQATTGIQSLDQGL